MKKCFVILCMCISCLFACQSESRMPKTSEAPVKIIFATDPHYISPALNDGGEAFQKLMSNGDGRYLYKIEEITEAFIQKCIEEKPDVVLLGGDLTFNGAVKSHEDLIEKLRRIEDAGIPVLLIPGNHDLGAYYDARFEGSQYKIVETMKPEIFREEYADFGLNEASITCEDSFSYVYELREDLWVLAIDANSDQVGILSDKTLAFAEEVQKEAKNKGAKMIIFTHQTILTHQIFIGGMRIENADNLIKILDPDTVILCLCGHMHIQHVCHEEGFTEAASSALSITPVQYAHISLDGRQLQYQTVSVDEKLAQEAREYFRRQAYERIRQELTEETDEENADLLAETFAQVNTAYFEGRNDPEIPSGGIDAWSKFGGPTAVYILSAVQEMNQGEGYQSFTLDE